MTVFSWGVIHGSTLLYSLCYVSLCCINIRQVKSISYRVYSPFSCSIFSRFAICLFWEAWNITPKGLKGWQFWRLLASLCGVPRRSAYAGKGFRKVGGRSDRISQQQMNAEELEIRKTCSIFLCVVQVIFRNLCLCIATKLDFLLARWGFEGDFAAQNMMTAFGKVWHSCKSNARRKLTILIRFGSFSHVQSRFLLKWCTAYHSVAGWAHAWSIQVQPRDWQTASHHFRPPLFSWSITFWFCQIWPADVW